MAADHLKRLRTTMSTAPVFTRKDYGFDRHSMNTVQQAGGQQSLSTWVPGPPATTPTALANRIGLTSRFLTPQVFTPREYKMHLNAQSRGESVPSLRTIPIVLFPVKSPEEDETRFVNWVDNQRHLRNFLAL